MSKIGHVTDADFTEKVLKAKLPVVVDFWANWCGPCRMMAPVLDKLADEYDGEIQVLKLDVDENPNTAAEYGIMSIPTLVVFKDGKEVKRLVGYLPLEQLKYQLYAHIN
ncbi:MAG: thioredoxin [Clostridia bacterium]|jgi:thioredoxin 1|nr:thioredoxin [Clostridia bacterium]